MLPLHLQEPLEMITSFLWKLPGKRKVREHLDLSPFVAASSRS